MLRLLAQRGEQGYEDIAALKGIGVDEVHAKVREALAQLESEGIPAPAIPAPGEAPPPPVERESAPDRAYGGSSQTRERPAASEGRRAPLALPSGREARVAIGAGLAMVVALVIVLLVSGGGGGETSTMTTTSGPETTAAESAGNAGGKEVTKAVLNPVDGSESAGVVVFGRVKNRLALQIAAEGLQPTGSGESYTIWLAASPQRMLPLASTEVGEDGRIGAQVVVPTEILAYLANETFGQIAITRTVDSQLQASLKRATSEKNAPDYTGTEVLRGTVTGPIVGAAKRQE